jgi:hypothetical protein
MKTTATTVRTALGPRRAFAIILTLLLGVVHVLVSLNTLVLPKWTPASAAQCRRGPADPAAVSAPRLPLRSYIPAGAHVLEVGPSIRNLTRLSLWEGPSELCRLLQLLEDSERGGDQAVSQWREHDFPFTDSSVIGNILRDLNVVLSRANTTGPRAEPIRVVLVVEQDCQEIFSSSILGTGNWLYAFYAMRLGALVASRSGKIQVDFLFDCHDAVDRRRDLVLPWLSGYYSSSWLYRPVGADHCSEGVVRDVANVPRNETSLSPFEELRQIVHQVHSVADVCDEKTPLTLMLPYMRYELRRMAVALVGMPLVSTGARSTNPARQRPRWGEQAGNEYYPPENVLKLPQPGPRTTSQAPLLNNVTMDDVAIHFRCGDLMQIRHPHFGFMKFSSFANRIHNTTAPFSIGILTQPFDVVNTSTVISTQSRAGDFEGEKGHLCRVTVHSFVDYLQARFPQATFRIHNGSEETVALAYARLVFANQAFSPISSFSIFPAFATLGRGYISYPHHGKSDHLWLTTPPLPRDVYDVTTNDSNGLRVVSATNSTMTQVELMDDPDILMALQVWKIRFKGARKPNMSVEETLIDWFTS